MSKVLKKRKIAPKQENQSSNPSSLTSSDDESFIGSGSGRMSVRKETEQRRRNMMNQHFDELVMMLSMVTDRVTPKKMDKTSILEEVVRVLRQYYDLDKCPLTTVQPQYRPGFFSRGEVFNFLLDALGAFLMLVLDNGRILYCSDLITSLTGHMPTRLIGQTIYDCVVPEDEGTIRSQFVPPADSTEVNIPDTPITAYSPRKFTCSMRLYSNDPSSMMISRSFVCLSYLRKWSEDQTVTSVDYFHEDTTSSNGDLSPTASSCILLLGKLADTDRPRDHSITTNDVNFEFSMRVSKEGKILEVDKQASLILGFTKADIQGASFFDYVDPYHSEKIGEAIDMFLSKGLGVSQPYRLCSKSGQYIWVVSKGFLSYNPWNHKPDHVLLESKVLGCDEVLPEYKFKIDTSKIPNPSEDYTPPQMIKSSFPVNTGEEAEKATVQPPPSLINQTHPPLDHFNRMTNTSVSPSSLQDPGLLFPSFPVNTEPLTVTTPTVENATNMQSMVQQLERKNQELFELQRRMLEQQQLFEQERRQFYQVTNHVMTYIGKNEGVSPQAYLDPNLSMAINSFGQSSLASGPSSTDKTNAYSDFGRKESMKQSGFSPSLFDMSSSSQFNQQPQTVYSPQMYPGSPPHTTMYSQNLPCFTQDTQKQQQCPSYPSNNFSLPNSMLPNNLYTTTAPPQVCAAPSSFPSTQPPAYSSVNSTSNLNIGTSNPYT